MRYLFIVLVGVLLLSWSSSGLCAEKAEFTVLLAQNRDKLEMAAAKVGNYPEALAAIDTARSSLKKAEQAYDTGRQWMGLGSLKPEAEQEVRHNLQMVDLALELALSRAARGKNVEDAAMVQKQIEMVNSRVKLLNERKQSEDTLRQAVQKCEATTNELAAAKQAHGAATQQLEQLGIENKKLQEQLATLTTEKAALMQELENLKKTVVEPSALPVPAATGGP